MENRPESSQRARVRYAVKKKEDTHRMAEPKGFAHSRGRVKMIVWSPIWPCRMDLLLPRRRDAGCMGVPSLWPDVLRWALPAAEDFVIDLRYLSAVSETPQAIIAAAVIKVQACPRTWCVSLPVAVNAVHRSASGRENGILVVSFCRQCRPCGCLLAYNRSAR